MELFIDNIKKYLFNPNNITKTRNNLKKEEKLTLNNMKSWEDKVVRVQDKGSRFLVLNNNNYAEKVEKQINTAIENLCIVDKLPSKIKDTNYILHIVDSISEFVLVDNYVLVGFDVVNMFPNIDNKSDLKSVKDVLLNNKFDLDFTQCIVDALEICLTCNNSKFNHQNFFRD